MLCLHYYSKTSYLNQFVTSIGNLYIGAFNGLSLGELIDLGYRVGEEKVKTQTWFDEFFMVI